MSQKDSNHSSTERTALWVIIPAAIGVSLLFTNLNHKMEPPREAVRADFSQAKKEIKMEESKAHEGAVTPKMQADSNVVEGAHNHEAPAEVHVDAKHR